MQNIEQILNEVKSGKVAVADAMQRIGAGFELDLGFARLDTDRPRRRGMPEAIYSPGKTSEQLVEIALALKKNRQDFLATRASPEQYAFVRQKIPTAIYHIAARIITVDAVQRPPPVGCVAVVSAGTSDIPVAEEAAVTAEYLGAGVLRVTDVGVAGLHRLMKHLPTLRSTRVVVVVAGMEGALPSVVGGLVDKPIVAVPTSTGYGTGLHGFSALLAMLNSCVPGVVVVNIDNGFGAGVAAAMINRLGEPADTAASA